MGNQLLVWNPSISTRNPDRDWANKLVVKRSLHQLSNTQIRTRNGLAALVQAIILFFASEHVMNTTPTDCKTPKGRRNATLIMRVRALYCQFCWDLVPSKLTTHKHYTLLRTRRSHRELKLISWQMRKKYKIKWMRLLTVKEKEEPFS